MNAKLRVALLGLEHPHSNSWQAAFRESPGAAFVGIWSQTPGLAKERSVQYGCDAWEDRDDLIEHSDAVAICSPTAQHRELIEIAARKGKKILCEKPIAGTLDDCRRIEKVVNETGAYYMQGFPKRFDPINTEIKKIIDSGELGIIFLVRIRHGHPFAAIDSDFRHSWFADLKQAGGGALLDEGVHAADFIRWLFGEPERVSCAVNHMVAELEVEETATALYRFANGLIAEITSSWHFLSAENSVEIYGSNGSLVLSGVDLGSRDLTRQGYLKCYIRPGRETKASHPALDLQDRLWQTSKTIPQFKLDTDVFHRNVAKAFVDFAAKGEVPPVTLEDGVRAVEMILSAYRAAESGKTEKVVFA